MAYEHNQAVDIEPPTHTAHNQLRRTESMVSATTTSVLEVNAAPLILPARNNQPLLHQQNSNGRITPIQHTNKADFGAEVHGIDLNNFSDADFDLISDALHTHKLLVFKAQPAMLSPQQQYRLTSRFDPDEKSGGFAHGADPFLTSHNGVDIWGIPKRPAIPIQPQVHILGRGKVPDNHYQFPPDFEIQGVDHTEFHLPPHLTPEERSAGASRFYQWHWDGAIYDIPPPRVGCLLAVKTPKGPDVTVRWEDGTGTEMAIAPGATAMVSGVQALSLLDDATRELVMNSRIEYAPHAFPWMAKARSTRLGHILKTEGKEIPLEQLPPWEPEKVCIYPMVWTSKRFRPVFALSHCWLTVDDD